MAVGLLVVCVTAVHAQGPPTLTVMGEPPGQITADAVAPGSFTPGPIVKGAPYSAEASTEVIQTLADGNRIVRRTSGLLYRDSRGRTRREEALGDIAGVLVSGAPLRTITINDPESGSTYVIDPDGRRGAQLQFQSAGPPPDPPDNRRQATQRAGATGNEESLGTRVIEGLMCEGTRRTTTIPAGAVGNERPITTVTERWFSPELQLLVFSRTSDPRFGETTYRLTKITRGEPPESLFRPPRPSGPVR
jgi:hypothetical protein